MLRNTLLRSVFVLGVVVPGMAQVPAPFPRPGQPGAQQPETPAAATPQPPPATPTNSVPGEPTEATLGAPIHPSAQFLESYDAGRGQRFFIFGSPSDFLQIVAFYRTMLKQRGDQVYAEPPVHMFDLARFREETMAFPPSVTIKDYTWGGSQGYLNPKRDGSPARFRTVIQIVPAPPVAPK